MRRLRVILLWALAILSSSAQGEIVIDGDVIEFRGNLRPGDIPTVVRMDQRVFADEAAAVPVCTDADFAAFRCRSQYNDALEPISVQEALAGYDQERHGAERWLARHRGNDLSPGNEADIEVPGEFESTFGSGGEKGIEPGRSIRDVEKDLILKTLEHVQGDKDRAARCLGISVRTLYNRLSEYDDPSD